VNALAAAVSLALTLAAGETAAQGDSETRCRLMEGTERGLLALPVQEFALTPESGWRGLYQAGCKQAAAELVEAYIAAHPGRAATHPVLYFQAGQLRGFIGAREAAIAHMREAIAANEQADGAHGPKWSTYVAATIAFLENDETALNRLYDELRGREDTPPGAPASYNPAKRGNREHITVVKGLIDCFDEDYETAYQNCRGR